MISSDLKEMREILDEMRWEKIQTLINIFNRGFLNEQSRAEIGSWINELQKQYKSQIYIERHQSPYWKC